MREISFRGKRVDNGEWIEGYLVKKIDPLLSIGKWFILIQRYDTSCIDGRPTTLKVAMTWYEVIPETVGQLTGLYDKNGVRIFESDICRFREWNNGDMCWIGKVHYEYQQFVISGEKNEECETPFTLMMSRFISENIEVIGNVYDNPELIGE